MGLLSKSLTCWMYWSDSPLSFSKRRRHIEYPFSKFGAYWSLVVAGLSVVLALLILTEPVLLISYFIFTFLLTVAVLVLKIHLLSTSESASLKSDSSKDAKNDQRWKIKILLLGFVISLIGPMILGLFLPPTSWFIGLNSFISGMSFSEVLLFCYARRSSP